MATAAEKLVSCLRNVFTAFASLDPTRVPRIPREKRNISLQVQGGGSWSTVTEPNYEVMIGSLWDPLANNDEYNRLASAVVEDERSRTFLLLGDLTHAIGQELRFTWGLICYLGQLYFRQTTGQWDEHAFLAFAEEVATEYDSDSIILTRWYLIANCSVERLLAITTDVRLRALTEAEINTLGHPALKSDCVEG